MSYSNFASQILQSGIERHLRKKFITKTKFSYKFASEKFLKIGSHSISYTTENKVSCFLRHSVHKVE